MIQNTQGPRNLSRLLWNEREAAKVLSISPRKLWTLRDSGRIPYVRIDRCVRYADADLKTWIEQNTTFPNPSVN